MAWSPNGVIGVSKWKMYLALIVALRTMPASAAAEDDLISAAGRGDISKIESLLADKVNVNARTTDVGMTALMFAATNGQIEAMQHLIAAHADVNMRGYKGVTALMLAAQRGQLKDRAASAGGACRCEGGHRRRPDGAFVRRASTP